MVITALCFVDYRDTIKVVVLVVCGNCGGDRQLDKACSTISSDGSGDGGQEGVMTIDGVVW